MSTTTSKLISLILRHDPAKFGVTLDRAGWTSVDALLAALAAHGHAITRTDLHSIDVELELAPAVPPDVLYHGTVDRFVASIRAQGLVKGERHHVHLSADVQTAKQVGGRRGKPVVLTVAAGR